MFFIMLSLMRIDSKQVANQAASQHMVQSYHIGLSGIQLCIGIFFGGMININNLFVLCQLVVCLYACSCSIKY